jgi:hypothetical protein
MKRTVVKRVNIYLRGYVTERAIKAATLEATK